MKKRNLYEVIGIAFLALTFTVSFASAVYSEKSRSDNTRWSLEFKLTGGIGKLLNRGGDLENVRKATIDWLVATGNQSYYKTSWNWKELSTIPDFNADVVLHFSRHFGVGIGSGFIAGSTKGETSTDYNYTGPGDMPDWTIVSVAADRSAEEYKISAIPIRLNLYCFAPIGSFQLYGYAGVGYYFGKLTHPLSSSYTQVVQFTHPSRPGERREFAETVTIEETAKRKTLGFQGGLGLGLNVLSHIDVALEVYARAVNFKSWNGDRAYTDDYSDKWWREGTGWIADTSTHHSTACRGTLWYDERLNAWLKQYYGEIYISDSRPSASYLRNVREAAINLNAVGISLSLGFKF